MPEGGDLKIETGIKGENVFATFTDTGIGMNEEAQLKIFEPFFTTKGFELGRGLGMSGVYSIIKKYNGDISVKSDGLNKGSTIEILFPISSNQEEILAPSEDECINNNTYKTLWVDDNFIISKSASILVKSFGHNCDIVNNGQKALEYLDNNICDIVFTDIDMPVMNGYELAKAIKQKFGNKIKVVAVTGWKNEENEEPVFDHVMPKPFTIIMLKKTFSILSSIIK